MRRREGRVDPQLGSLDLAVEKGTEGEKGKECRLGWGVQALLFHFKHCSRINFVPL